MSGMVEQAARAMAEAEGEFSNGSFAGEFTRTHWMRRARLAIAAIREPTEAMLAATAVNAQVANDLPDLAPKLDWQTMIDEALKE
jgi:hypothetical protein